VSNKKHEEMDTAIQTTRKNLDISNEVLHSAKIAAATAGVSVKRYLENLLELHVPKFEVHKKHVNPSPSGDPWFDDPENLKMIEEAAQEIREGKGIKFTQADLDELLSHAL
jgi:hypothetical protein